ncbi:hypothetical protein JR065_18255 [Xanthomonas sp. AmX2]|uniref:hypothetical protein n=1 Tax=Xanthomonas sp. TaxID=29446 RepID=UPI00198173AD|nr:hypothetical protein [Xanthomonas sp.]MBN6152287.1 hypothetical protein [Xanthomonas sp.]
MRLGFRSLSSLAAVLFFVIACIWMFSPGSMLANWNVGVSPPAELVARRAAALYAGIGVMLFMARKAAPSPARAALVAGIVTACSLLALLGVVELAAGHAGSGIALAVVLEVAFAVAFVSIGGRS